MTSKTTKLYLRQPRIAWQNKGGPVPYRLRGYVKKRGKKIVTTRSETVGKNQWLIIAGREPYVFTTAIVNRVYARSAPT